MKRRIITAIVGLVLVVIASYGIYLGVPRYDYFIDRVGTLVDAEIIEEERAIDRGYIVRLRSSTAVSYTHLRAHET